MRNICRAMGAVILFALLAGAPWAPAWADGGFFSQSVAISSDQRAIVISSGGSVSLTVSTAYSGPGADFAWVIPVPAPPRAEDIKEHDELGQQAFGQLEMMTAPRIIGRPAKSRTSFGCASEQKVYSQKSDLMVHHIAHVALDSYEADVLSARGAGSLLDWLNQRGYNVSDRAKSVLGAYIADGWFFVALKLNPAERRDYQDEALPAVTIRMRTGRMVFPMRISSVSSQGEVKLSLFAIAESTVSSPNYPTQNLIHQDQLEPGLSPEAHVAEAIRATSGQNGVGLARVYASSFYSGEQGVFDQIHGVNFEAGKTYYVTRLETVLAPEDMNQDIDLALDPQPVDFRVTIMAQAAPDAGGRNASFPDLAPTMMVVGGVYLGARSLRRRAGARPPAASRREVP